MLDVMVPLLLSLKYICGVSLSIKTVGLRPFLSFILCKLHSFFFFFQNNEKQMRQLSVIPPMMFDAEQRRVKFINMNGLMEDPMKIYKDRQFMNVWTDHEKEIFKDK